MRSLNRVRRKYGKHAVQASLLAGIIWDGEGRRMTPDHASKKGQRYRYYASQKDKERPELPIHRLPANEIEKLVIHQLAAKSEASWEGLTPSRELVLEYVERVTVHSERVEILFTGTDEPVSIAAELIRCGGEVRIDAPGQWMVTLWSPGHGVTARVTRRACCARSAKGWRPARHVVLR